MYIKSPVFLDAAKEMDEICFPLRRLGIDFFHYVKSFNDGSEISLCNFPDWPQYFYEQDLFKVGAFEQASENYTNGYFLWSTLDSQLVFNEARRQFSIDHGIIVIRSSHQESEFFYFGTRSGNKDIINFYINNLQLLDRFIFYFQDRGRGLLGKAHDNKIILPDILRKQKKDLFLMDSIIDASDRLRFLNNTQIKKLHFNLIGQEIILTRREIDCVAFLVQGETAEMTATKLCISRRTVEKHINNIKEKCGCKTKNQLIKKLVNAPVNLIEIL